MAGTGPADLQTLAQELLDAAEAALDTIPLYDATLTGAPDRVFIGAGTPAIDCCDQLTVHVAQILDAPTAPGGLASGRKIAGKINHVYLLTTISRCVPMPDERGRPPAPDLIQEAAEQLNADAWALWNHLYNLWRENLLFTLCDEVFWDSLRPLGPAGGCAGWVLSIHVSLDGYEEAVSS